MKSERWLLVLIGLAGLALGIGYGVVGQARWGLGSLGVLLLWLAAEARGNRQFGWAGLVATVGLAAIGTYFDIPTAALILAVVASLSAWDLSRFHQRMKGVAAPNARLRMEKQHIIRLATVNGIGLVLAILSASIRLQITFVGIFLMALLLILVIFQALMMLAKWEE